jgi:membrane-anchored protein YejM (alkaline phosphatase superfamily)
MNPSLPLVSTSDDEETGKKRRKLLALLVLLGLYLCGHTVGRWLAFTLWFKEEAINTTLTTPPPETAYQVYMACLPVLVWGLLVYLAALRFPRVLKPGVILLLTLLALTFVEVDMPWYQRTKQHLSWNDIEAFFRADGEHDLGLRDADYWRFAGLMGVHAVCFGFLCLLAPRLARRPWFHGVTRWRWKTVALVLACLTAVDLVVVRSFASENNEEEGNCKWAELARANPLRLRFLDDLFDVVADWITGQRDELEAANELLASLPFPEREGPRSGPSVRPFPVRFRDPPNVVVIAVESLNVQVMADTDLPFYKGFARRCLRLTNHYTTGNCTQYGLLGLMYASPVTFYRGQVPDPGSRSPYLDLFTARGYRSRLISTPLLYHQCIGDYLTNFSAPTFVGTTDRSLVPAFRKEMARKGPRFTFLFYNNTHYPYKHLAKYRTYLPEVPGDFDYSRWDVQNYKVPILNRYKNCLVEWDAWLKEIIGAIDLTQTVVIITGDHGEELFQEGRLCHGSNLNDHQTKTPCLIHIPGVAGRDVTALTSHADLLPSVVEVLGWQPPAQPGLGRSIFQPGGTRFAVIANQNYARRPQRWALLTEGCKTILEGDTAADLRISGLLDWQGRPLSFLEDPDRWTDNFEAVKRFQAELP